MNIMMKPLTTAPNAIPWPPLIYGAAAVVAWLLGTIMPSAQFVPTALHPIGGVTMLAGLILDLSAMLTMYRQRANILPHRAATTLVTSFPFSISRNPIYLGNTILVAGAALVFGNLWFVLLDAGSRRPSVP